MTKVSKTQDIISVIIPIHNAEEYLPRCLDSVAAQTYKQLEVLLVDNNSTDNSHKICKDFAEANEDKFMIKILKCKTPGVSAARNYGLKKATGNWTTFLDADDAFEPNFCKKMLSTAHKYSAEYVCCGYYRVTATNKEPFNNSGKIDKFNKREFIIRLLNPTLGYGFVHMKLISTKLAKKITFDEQLVVAEDALYNLELAKILDKVIILNQPLYNYFINPSSTVRNFSTRYPDIFYRSMKALSKDIESTYPADPAFRQANYNFVAHHLLLVLVNYCAHPQNENQLESIKNLLNRPLFRSAIEHANFSEFPLPHRVTLHLLKHHFYRPALTIGHIRLKNNGVTE